MAAAPPDVNAVLMQATEGTGITDGTAPAGRRKSLSAAGRARPANCHSRPGHCLRRRGQSRCQPMSRCRARRKPASDDWSPARSCGRLWLRRLGSEPRRTFRIWYSAGTAGRAAWTRASLHCRPPPRPRTFCRASAPRRSRPWIEELPASPQSGAARRRGRWSAP